MTTRRQVLLAGALGALVSPFASPQARPPRVGILSGLPFEKSVLAPVLLKALAELGYRDGAGMVLEYRSIDGLPDRYPGVARELIARKCDVIFTFGGTRALRDAQTSIPIVFLAFDYDPLEQGLVASFQRPGANITGVYTPAGALAAKRLEIAQEVLPGASRFLLLTDQYGKTELVALRKAAEARRVQLVLVDYEQPPYDLAAGIETGRRAGVHGVLLTTSPEFASRRAELSSLFVSYRLPAVVPAFMASQPGSLVSYSTDMLKLAQQAAAMGVRILKGAKPVDIPVEQVNEFELVVNLKMAKMLGVKIPYSVLARATKVIE